MCNAFCCITGTQKLSLTAHVSKDFASFAYLKMVFKVSFRGLNCDPIKLILEEHDV